MKNRKLKPRWVLLWKHNTGAWYLHDGCQFRTPEAANAFMVEMIFEGYPLPLRVVRKLCRSRAPAKPRCLK